MIGYVFYVDRFAGTLRGVEEHIGYLERARRAVRPPHAAPADAGRRQRRRLRGGRLPARWSRASARWPTWSTSPVELRGSGDQHLHRPRPQPLRGRARLGGPGPRWRPRGVRALLDLPGPGAARPVRGDRCPRSSRTSRRATSRALPDGRWVWTTFNAFQWDLNWSNPRVFVEIVDVLLELANAGIDVFRLDAVAFMWKRMGTNCQNQPEVHSLLRALRACARVAAPAVIFKAEAIVGPDDLAPYLGVGQDQSLECDLAYHNSLMVQYWSALATRDTRLMTHVLSAFPKKPADHLLGHLHPLPRRHRLGDHRGGRGGRRVDRSRSSGVPLDVLRGALPGFVRAR